MSSDPPKRRWYQFSLKALLIVMLVSCIGFAWIGWRMRRAQRNRERVAAVEAIIEIEKMGGFVDTENEPRRPPSWLEELLDDPGGPDDPVHVVRVTYVALGSSKITDTGLEHLTGLSHVRLLCLDGTKITDAGLEHLSEWKSLEILTLNKTKVTDAGMEHLKGLTNLRALRVPDTVTDEGIEKLQQALPNCRIFR